MRRLLFGILIALLLTGCGAQGSPPGADAGTATIAGPSTGTTTGGQPYDLYTHCGIDEAHFEGGWYERDGGLLQDASGNMNPPLGWDNLSQAGTMARIDAETIVFTDELGHRETFTLRPGATDPKQVCA